MISKLVGKRLKELRVSQKLSQETLANSVEMSRTYYAEVETGKRNVTVKNLKRLTDGLGVSLQEFFASPIFREDTVTFNDTTPSRTDYYLIGTKK